MILSLLVWQNNNNYKKPSLYQIIFHIHLHNQLARGRIDAHALVELVPQPRLVIFQDASDLTVNPFFMEALFQFLVCQNCAPAFS